MHCCTYIHCTKGNEISILHILLKKNYSSHWTGNIWLIRQLSTELSSFFLWMAKGTDFSSKIVADIYGNQIKTNTT